MCDISRAGVTHAYFTIREVATYLRVSRGTVFKFIDSNCLPVMRLGPRQIRIKRTDLEALERQLSQHAIVPQRQ